MLNRIRTLADQAGKTTVLSTHILPDVRQVCNQVIILAQGTVKLSDTMENVNRPADPGLFVRVLDDAAEFERRLSQTFQVRSVNEHEVFVSGDVEGREAAIWKVASASGHTITSLHASQNSLEEVFMRAVEEG